MMPPSSRWSILALTKEQQAFELISKSSSILITSSPGFKIDALSSTKSLEHALRGLEKSVQAHLPFETPEHVHFLVPPRLSPSPKHPQGDFILKIDTQKAPVKELRYEKEGHELKIFLTPEGTDLRPEHISFEATRPRYDLIISCLAPDLESLGELFEKNPRLFFETPIINIDIDPANEHYGELNLIDITASSGSEIVTLLLDAMNPSLVDGEIATLLLAGLISSTDNFRKGNVTPTTLTVAASLMSRGADHEKIVRYLYKSRPLILLKLLGKTLSNIKLDDGRRLVWSVIAREDFEETGAHPRLLPSLLEEIREQFSSVDTAIVFWEHPGGGETSTIRGLALTTKSGHLEALRTIFGGEVKNGFLVMDEAAKTIPDLERLVARFPFLGKGDSSIAFDKTEK